MSDTKKPRARKENSDGTSGAAVTAPTESPSHRDQENADQPSQHGSEKPVAADAQHERQQDEQGGKDKQDGSVPKSTSDQKPEPAKGPSFKERARKRIRKPIILCLAIACMPCTCGMSAMWTDSL